MRTEEERRDQVPSWKRTDAAFFAAGACHVLAFRFLARHAGEMFAGIYLRPRNGLPGSHTYVSDGTWAFDFNGWTLEEVLLSESAADTRRRWPGWDFDRIVVEKSLDQFCVSWQHRLPSEYAGDVIRRADGYLDRLGAHPPTR
jgi:hypothetical protein